MRRTTERSLSGNGGCGSRITPVPAILGGKQTQQDERIRSSNAKILLVAFGQPKGEQWIFDHYKQLGIPASILLGASFDFIAGTANRALAIWQRVGMEWVDWMLSDPKRLVPRYASNAAFPASRSCRGLEASGHELGHGRLDSAIVPAGDGPPAKLKAVGKRSLTDNQD